MSTPAKPTASATRRPTARERARAEVTAEILDAAREQLANEGASALSLRAIARSLGMASSAVYRYFPSRDDLLTQLIVEAYASVGLAAEAAYEEFPNGPAADQLRAVWHAVRSWALSHPHEYALIFGSPVPGYRAPETTIGPATRVPWVLLNILITSHPEHRRSPAPISPTRLAAAGAALQPLRSQVPKEAIDDGRLVAALTSWATLFGAISMELFGHIHNVVEEDPASRMTFFDAQIDLMIRLVEAE